jgi:hypothetical protein
MARGACMFGAETGSQQAVRWDHRDERCARRSRRARARADRAEWRWQDHGINLLTGVLRPTAGPSARRPHHQSRAHKRVQLARAHLPDQPAVRRADAAETIGLASPSAWSSAVSGAGRVESDRDRGPVEILQRRSRRRDGRTYRQPALTVGQRLLEIALAIMSAAGAPTRRAAAGVPEAQRRDILDAVAALPTTSPCR